MVVTIARRGGCDWPTEDTGQQRELRQEQNFLTVTVFLQCQTSCSDAVNLGNDHKLRPKNLIRDNFAEKRRRNRSQSPVAVIARLSRAVGGDASSTFR